MVVLLIFVTAFVVGGLAGYLVSKERHYAQGYRACNTALMAGAAFGAVRTRHRPSARVPRPRVGQLALTAGDERDPIYLAETWIGW